VKKHLPILRKALSLRRSASWRRLAKHLFLLGRRPRSAQFIPKADGTIEKPPAFDPAYCRSAQFITKADGTIEKPPAFDPAYYRLANPDLRHMTDQQLLDHFRQYGESEGRAASAAAKREHFLELIPRGQPLLEIGPWYKPAIVGPHVRYCDVFSRDELMKRAADLGGNPESCPEIHYVLKTGDLSAIPDRFSAVFSSHSIEHQPDLVRHLQAVGNLLLDGGCYFLIVPDKRYCFDHFIAESTIADVLDTHLRKVRRHEPRRILEYRLLRTHNDSLRHWQGDHERPLIEGDPALLERAIQEASIYDQTYIDTHAWRFTPVNFSALTETIFRLGLSGLKPIRVYNTPHGRNEFTAILQKG
jgi:SAM-dependent methyltransferase